MLSPNKKEGCQKCYERGYHTRNSIDILTICKYCGGRGCVDWIDRMTGNPSPIPFDKPVERKIIMRNVEHLMGEIKVMLHKINIDALVTVEERTGHNHSILTFGSNLGNHTHVASEIKKSIILAM